MKTTAKSILANIIKIRNDKGLTQAAIAEGIEVDYSTYSKLESGQTKLSIDRFEEIARFHNMDMIDVLTYPHKFVLQDELHQKEFQKQRTKVIVQIEIEEERKKEEILTTVFGNNKPDIF